MKYITIIRIVCEGQDKFDAGDRAGSIINVKNMKKEIIVDAEPTRPLESNEI